MYKGIAGSEGIGIGKAVLIEEHEINVEAKKVTDMDGEIARLQKAIEKFCSGQVKLLHLGRTYFCLCLASNGVSPPLYECGLTWLYHKNT